MEVGRGGRLRNLTCFLRRDLLEVIEMWVQNSGRMSPLLRVSKWGCVCMHCASINSFLQPDKSKPGATSFSRRIHTYYSCSKQTICSCPLYQNPNTFILGYSKWCPWRAQPFDARTSKPPTLEILLPITLLLITSNHTIVLIIN